MDKIKRSVVLDFTLWTSGIEILHHREDSEIRKYYRDPEKVKRIRALLKRLGFVLDHTTPIYSCGYLEAWYEYRPEPEPEDYRDNEDPIDPSPDNLDSIADRLLESFYTDLYTGQIETQDFDWPQIQLDCEDNAEFDPDSGQNIGICFLGTVFAIMPSGKYWTVWASGNVDRLEQIKDSAYTEALSAVAEQYGLSIESGEGNPCDLFAILAVESDPDD